MNNRLINKNNDLSEIKELFTLIERLRSPDGCPWDRQQKKEDMGRYLLEEAYEVADSLQQGNIQAIKEELGDLLFQILFLIQICTEEKLFSFREVADEVTKKMIRRHPHVFGNKKEITVREVKENWQKIKEQERGNKDNNKNLFDNIPLSLPALKRAQKITSIVSPYGFDWPDSESIVNQLKEELNEFENALKENAPHKKEEELGDLLFTLVNLSRFHAIDAESALSKTIQKFLRRFSYIQDKLSSRGISLKMATPAQMNELWNESKILEEQK